MRKFSGFFSGCVAKMMYVGALSLLCLVMRVLQALRLVLREADEFGRGSWVTCRSAHCRFAFHVFVLSDDRVTSRFLSLLMSRTHSLMNDCSHKLDLNLVVRSPFIYFPLLYASPRLARLGPFSFSFSFYSPITIHCGLSIYEDVAVHGRGGEGRGEALELPIIFYIRQPIVRAVEIQSTVRTTSTPSRTARNEPRAARGPRPTA